RPLGPVPLLGRPLRPGEGRFAGRRVGPQLRRGVPPAHAWRTAGTGSRGSGRRVPALGFLLVHRAIMPQRQQVTCEGPAAPRANRAPFTPPVRAGPAPTGLPWSPTTFRSRHESGTGPER